MKSIIYSSVVLFMMTSCGNKKATNTPAENTTKEVAVVDEQIVSLTEQQRKNAGVEVGLPSFENIDGVITLQGAIDVAPQNTANLSCPLGGYIKSTNMLPGKAVIKGEVLAVIEDIQFVQLQQDYLTAKTNYGVAELEYNRQRVLNESKATSDKVYEQAKAEMDRQRILISALAEKLKMIGINAANLTPASVRKEVTVVSPLNGYITQVNVTIGKYASPTDILFTIVDPSDKHLALKVFEKDLDKITVGLPVSAYTNANPTERYKAKIILVNRTFDENRMAEVHCHFEQNVPGLAPGMFMNGEVAVQGMKGIIVPEDAMVRWENKYYVFVETKPETYKMTEVKPGIQHDKKQQIEGQGITADTKVVLKNAFALLMKIKNTESEE